MNITKRLPELALAVWISILALGIWLHTHVETQPPLSDAFAYYLKAYNVWTVWEQNKSLNPFNIWPFFRPPGTILMSYPFGFSFDPKWFFFRSVFFPAILLVLSVLVISYSPDGSIFNRGRCVLTAMLFSTTPMFYMFEMNPLTSAPGTWGLVDSFLTGCAAFSISCAWRSVAIRSPDQRWLWYLLTGLSAGFCITIKPSGVVVACLVCFEWAYISLFILILPEKDITARKSFLKETLLGAICIATPIFSTLWIATSSAYLSGASLAIGKANIAVMKIDLTISDRQFFGLIHHYVGEVLILWTVIVLIAVSIVNTALKKSSAKSQNLKSAIIAIIAALVSIIFGVWFWIVATGGATEMRYGMPFIMMGLLLLVPAVNLIWDRCPIFFTRMLIVLSVLAPANLALLLFVPHPSIRWQMLAGVSVTPPPTSGIQAALYALTNLPHKNGQYLYSIPVDFQYEITNEILQDWWLLNPHKVALGIILPIDWIRPATFRISEVSASTYILVDNPSSPQKNVCDIDTFGDETRAMTVWADTLTDKDGVEIIYVAADARILRIVDHTKITNSLKKLLSEHHWRPVFKAANSAFFSGHGV